MTDILNPFINWLFNAVIQLWNFCTSTWILAFPIALTILARLYDLTKKFLGK